MHLLAIGLAIESYRQVNKRFPSDLKDVESEILQEIPSDPLTGGAYVYGLDGDDYFLYSSYYIDEKHSLDGLAPPDVWWRYGEK